MRQGHSKIFTKYSKYLKLETRPLKNIYKIFKISKTWGKATRKFDNISNSFSAPPGTLYAMVSKNFWDFQSANSSLSILTRNHCMIHATRDKLWVYTLGVHSEHTDDREHVEEHAENARKTCRENLENMHSLHLQSAVTSPDDFTPLDIEPDNFIHCNVWHLVQ